MRYATLIVLLIMLVLARLGFWQLDRLQQRRASNLILAATLAKAPLDLANDVLPQDVTSLKNRQVLTTGEFDFDHQE